MFRNLFGRGNASTIKQINVRELYQLLAGEQPIQLIDVRSNEEYNHDGHVSDSKLIPLPVLAQRIEELDRNTPVVLICRSGNRSQVAADLLARQGFTDLTNVQGGMIAWKQAGFPAT